MQEAVSYTHLMLSNYNSFYNKTDINDLYAVDRDNLVQNIYSGFGDNLKAIIDVRARQWTESNDQEMCIRDSYKYGP